jgi:Holliday junction resolvase-like predicted endonuclease
MTEREPGSSAAPRGLRGARNQQTRQAGEYFVAAELCRRGAYAVTFAGNMPGIDILASNTSRDRIIQIQVKTKRSGDWHTSRRNMR